MTPEVGSVWKFTSNAVLAVYCVDAGLVKYNIAYRHVRETSPPSQRTFAEWQAWLDEGKLVHLVPDIAPHTAELAAFHKLARHWGWTGAGDAPAHLSALIRSTIAGASKCMDAEDSLRLELAELQRTLATLDKRSDP